MNPTKPRIKRLICFIGLLCFFVFGNQVEAQEKESRPTWLSILVPGLGDYSNNNPKLATFWFGSTLFVGALHKISIDNMHTQKDNYHKTADIGLFYAEDTTWTLYTYYKFKNARHNYLDSYSRYNTTGNFLIAWWIINFLSAQVNYNKLFKMEEKSSTLNLNIFKEKQIMDSPQTKGISYEVEVQWKF